MAQYQGRDEKFFPVRAAIEAASAKDSDLVVPIRAAKGMYENRKACLPCRKAVRHVDKGKCPTMSSCPTVSTRKCKPVIQVGKKEAGTRPQKETSLFSFSTTVSLSPLLPLPFPPSLPSFLPSPCFFFFCHLCQGSHRRRIRITSVVQCCCVHDLINMVNRLSSPRYSAPPMSPPLVQLADRQCGVAYFFSPNSCHQRLGISLVVCRVDLDYGFSFPSMSLSLFLMQRWRKSTESIMFKCCSYTKSQLSWKMCFKEVKSFLK